MMKWCCAQFEGFFQEAGNRGLAVLADRDAEGRPVFILQHRSIEMDAPIPTGYPGLITLTAEVHIHYCPWSGHRLRDFYTNAIDAMLRPQFRQEVATTGAG